MQFLCYFLHVFVFPCAKKKRSSFEPFLIFLCKLNFSLDVSWMVHEKLKLSEERASFPWGGSGWQGRKCIQASKLQLHGWKAYRSRLFNSCYVKKFSRQIHWELAEASLKKMKSSWRGVWVSVYTAPFWNFICKANNEKNCAADSKNQPRTLTHGWKAKNSQLQSHRKKREWMRLQWLGLGSGSPTAPGGWREMQNAYTNAMRKYKIEK